MKTFSIIALVLVCSIGCASTPPQKQPIETTSSYQGTEWERCCINDIAPVIIRTPRKRIRVNIWVNSWWSSRGGW